MKFSIGDWQFSILLCVLCVFALMLSGCTVLEIKGVIKERAAVEINKTHAHFIQPEVKAQVLADARQSLEAQMDKARNEVLETYDKKAPLYYDKFVDAMLNPGILGLIASALGFTLKVAFGAGVL